MPIAKRGYVFLIMLSGLYGLVTALVLLSPWDSFITLFVRLFALYGYIALTVATALTPFLRSILRVFGHSFLRIHHVFSIFGLIFVTMHPISLAIREVNILVFLPSFASWFDFWSLAGRPALIIIYIAVVAALLRRKILRYWRVLHALMYVVMFFGIVHANLSGSDFNTLGIQLIFNALFVTSLGALVFKRFRTRR